jgi:hypothetical protein
MRRTSFIRNHVSLGYSLFFLAKTRPPLGSAPVLLFFIDPVQAIFSLTAKFSWRETRYP